MGIECAYSFDDLHFAVVKKHFSALESERFLRLNQQSKNDLVAQWAAKAGWETEEKIGSDGLVDIAFWPKN